MRTRLVPLIVLLSACTQSPTRHAGGNTAFDAGGGEPPYDAARADSGPADAGSTPTARIAFKQLALGSRNACGIRKTDGTMVCRGDELASLQKMTSPASKYVPAPASSESFLRLWLTSSVACALRPDGTPLCWGFDDEQQSDAPATQHFTQITSNTTVSCGLDAQGTAVCWGTPASFVLPTDKLVQLAANSECRSRRAPHC